jgi:hypothetical protein
MRMTTRTTHWRVALHSHPRVHEYAKPANCDFVLVKPELADVRRRSGVSRVVIIRHIKTPAIQSPRNLWTIATVVLVIAAAYMRKHLTASKFHWTRSIYAIHSICSIGVGSDISYACIMAGRVVVYGTAAGQCKRHDQSRKHQDSVAHGRDDGEIDDTGPPIN